MPPVQQVQLWNFLVLNFPVNCQLYYKNVKNLEMKAAKPWSGWPWKLWSRSKDAEECEEVTNSQHSQSLQTSILHEAFRLAQEQQRPSHGFAWLNRLQHTNTFGQFQLPTLWAVWSPFLSQHDWALGHKGHKDMSLVWMNWTDLQSPDHNLIEHL